MNALVSTAEVVGMSPDQDQGRVRAAAAHLGYSVLSGEFSKSPEYYHTPDEIKAALARVNARVASGDVPVGDQGFTRKYQIEN